MTGLNSRTDFSRFTDEDLKRQSDEWHRTNRTSDPVFERCTDYFTEHNRQCEMGRREQARRRSGQPVRPDPFFGVEIG